MAEGCQFPVASRITNVGTKALVSVPRRGGGVEVHRFRGNALVLTPDRSSDFMRILQRTRGSVVSRDRADAHVAVTVGAPDRSGLVPPQHPMKKRGRFLSGRCLIHRSRSGARVNQTAGPAKTAPAKGILKSIRGSGLGRWTNIGRHTAPPARGPKRVGLSRWPDMVKAPFARSGWEHIAMSDQITSGVTARLSRARPR